MNVYLPASDAGADQLLIMKPDGRSAPASVILRRPVDSTGSVRIKIYVADDFVMTDGIYCLLGKTLPHAAAAPTVPAAQSLKNARLELRFGSHGKVEGLFIDGIRKLDAGSLMHYFRYHDRMMSPNHLRISPLDYHNGVASIKLQGIWLGPQNNTQTPGDISYQFSLVNDLPYLFVDGNTISAPMEQALVQFAGSPVIVSLLHDKREDNGLKKLSPPVGFEAISIDDGVYFRWEQAGSNVDRYRVYCGDRPESYKQVLITNENGLMVHGLGDGRKFKEGRTYYAMMEAVQTDGTLSEKTSQIAFTISPPHPHAYPPRVSLKFQLKVLWANIAAYLSR